ncbi:hypothetical protein GCM10027347_55700 [Larkinella harenae]
MALATSQQQVLDSVAQIAQRMKWPDIGEQIRQLFHDEAEPALLVLTPASLDSADFGAWLAEMAISYRVDHFGGETAGRDARLVSKVLVYLTPDYILQGEDMEFLRATVLWRPLTTYAIVFGNTQAIDDDLELHNLDERMQRLFSRSAYPFNTSLNPLDFGCYLWGPAERRPFLAERVKADQASLKHWLHLAESGSQNELRKAQVSNLLHMAEERLELVTLHSSPQAQSTVELSESIQEINDLRVRVMRRMDETRLNTVRELTNTLYRLEERLKTEWHHEAYTTRDAKGNLDALLHRGLKEWNDSIRLNARIDQLIKDLLEPIESTDWDLVNKWLGGKTGPYPQAFDLTNSESNLLREWVKSSSQGPSSSSTQSDALPSGRLQRILIAGIVVTGVGLISRAILPTIFAGGLASAALEWNERRISENNRTAIGTKYIEESIRRQINEVNRRMPEIFEPLEEHFNTEFKRLRQGLEAELERQRFAHETASDAEMQFIQTQLSEMRQQLL